MRSFPANFAAALADKMGQAPVWIFAFTAGGTTYYCADDIYDTGGYITKPWVARWGQVRDGLGGGLSELQVAEFSVDLLIDPDASPNIETLATGYALEESVCKLYLWMRGSGEAPQEMVRGYIRDIGIPDNTMVSLSIEDESSRLNNYIGTRITKAVYPDADPDDVGKILPLIYGTVAKVPLPAVDAGIQTSLPSNINASTQSVTVSDATGLEIGTVVQVDEEQMLIGNVVGDVLTVTRGYNTTVAVDHAKAAVVWEHKAEFVYLLGSPVDSLSKVYVRLGEAECDVTAIAMRYLGSGTVATVSAGQVGGQHPSYLGKACVVVPGYITAQQAVSIGLTDGIGVSDTISVADAIGVSDTIGVSNPSHAHQESEIQAAIDLDSAYINSGSTITSPNDYGYNSIDGNMEFGTLGAASGVTLSWHRSKPLGLPGYPTWIRGAILLKSNAFGSVTVDVYAKGSLVASMTAYHNGTIQKTSWVSVSGWSWADVISGQTFIRMTATGSANPKEVWLEIQYDPTGPGTTQASSKVGSAAKTGLVSKSGSATKTGTVTINGNSTANTLVGDMVLVDVVRTKTAPQTISEIMTLAGFAGSVTCDTIYGLNGALLEYQRALDILSKIAMQLCARFRVRRGVAAMTTRTVPVGTHAIPACRVDQGGVRMHSRRKIPYSELINVVNVQYERDWSRSGNDAYKAVLSGTAATSIASYGTAERPIDDFSCDFVTTLAHAEFIRDFYLQRHGSRRWEHTFDVFLDMAALEFGDDVALGFAGDVAGEIVQANYAPGSTGQVDAITFVVEE